MRHPGQNYQQDSRSIEAIRERLSDVAAMSPDSIFSAMLIEAMTFNMTSYGLFAINSAC